MFARKLRWSFLLIAVLLTVTTVTGWAQCSQATLNGALVLFEQRTIVVAVPGFPSPPIPVALVGKATSDGAGHVSGKSTGSFGGVIVTATVTGTYDVTADCAYSATLKIDSSIGQFFENQTGFITGEGTFLEVHYINTDSGDVVFGTIKKQ